MSADLMVFLLVWFNGFVFGLLVALLAGGKAARRQGGSTKESACMGEAEPQPPLEAAVAPVPREGALYPEPETVEEGRCVHLLADELPPIVADGIEWAWADAGHRRGNVVVVPAEDLARERVPTFVLGDLHGDAAALRRILACVWRAHPHARVVFLGDLVDRADGAVMLECARLFLWAARREKGRFLWIRGNHDYLARNAETGQFCTSVEPHEFCDFLNRHPDSAAEGEALGEIMAGLPVGAVLGNVWLSHGGILQDDEAGLRSFSGFAAMTDEMQRDLIWTRMRDVPTKLAFRGSAGAEAGLRQAGAFVQRVREVEGAEIAHVVCAHQHESHNGIGYLPFDKCFTGGLTCQCVASFAERGVRPAFLRLDGTGIPVPFSLPVESNAGIRMPDGENRTR